MFITKIREDRGKRIAAYFLACAALTFLAFLPWMFPAVAALTTITAAFGWAILIILLLIAMAMSDSNSSFGGSYSSSTNIYAPTTNYYPPVTPAPAPAQSPTDKWDTWKVIGNYLFTIILLAGALYFLFLFSQDLSVVIEKMFQDISERLEERRAERNEELKKKQQYNQDSDSDDEAEQPANGNFDNDSDSDSDSDDEAGQPANGNSEYKQGFNRNIVLGLAGDDTEQPEGPQSNTQPEEFPIKTGNDKQVGPSPV